MRWGTSLAGYPITLHYDPLPLPAYRGDRLESALRTVGLWPDSRAVVLCRPDAWGRVSLIHSYTPLTPMSPIRLVLATVLNVRACSKRSGRCSERRSLHERGRETCRSSQEDVGVSTEPQGSGAGERGDSGGPARSASTVSTNLAADGSKALGHTVRLMPPA